MTCRDREEKRKSLDNKYSLLYHTCLNSIIDNKKYKSILGELKDIKSINETFFLLIPSIK